MLAYSDWQLSYEFLLTMKTESGQLVPVKQFLYPEYSLLSVYTSPPGQSVYVNDVARRSPFHLKTIVGMEQTVAPVDEVLVEASIFGFNR